MRTESESKLACLGVSRLASRSSDSAETNSPQTLWRGNRPRSSNRTRAPLRAQVIAAEVPAGPPPITINWYMVLSLPRDSPHTEEGIALNLHVCGPSLPQHLTHFLNRIRSTYGSRRVVVREVTAIERQTQINQANVNWVADQIVDDDRGAAYPQTLVHKCHYFVWFEMMSKQAATH